MADSSFGISVDLPSAGNLPFTRDGLPHLARAVEEVTAAALALWQGYASGAPMPNGKVVQNGTGEYLRSILTRELGDFAGEVFTDAPIADSIENGVPERDLKRLLASSLKVRLSRDGHRFLVIPFRHNTPGSAMGKAMPEAVHSWWQHPDRKRSAVVGMYLRPSGTGAFDINTRQPLTVPARRYVWGSRLEKSDLAKLGVTGPAARHMAGMVNFRRPGTQGGAAQSRYISFRTMSERSKPGSWIAKARPGMHPAQTVSDQIRPEAETVFKAAFEADLAAALGGVVE